MRNQAVNHDVTGVFSSRKRARKALMHLLSSGIPRNAVHLTAPDDESAGAAQFKLQSKISIVATVSAGVGGVVGALAGNISEIDPIVAAVLGISLGVLIGGIIGSLIGAELTEQDSYEMATEEKNCFLVRVDPKDVPGVSEKNIERILRSDGAIKVKHAS